MGEMNTIGVALFAACLGIVLGLVPLGGVIENLRDAIDRIRMSFYGAPAVYARPVIRVKRDGRMEGQIWFAVAGVALIVFVLLEYLLG